MKIKQQIEIEKEAKYFTVNAGVRYWEDGEVNGIDDISYDEQQAGVVPRMPFAKLDGKMTNIAPCGEYRWIFDIDIDEGNIVGWPKGVSASVHYKVCDDGSYGLKDAEGNVIVEKDMYVPDILCLGKDGWGDYIILDINEDGHIIDWENTDISDLILQYLNTEGF